MQLWKEGAPLMPEDEAFLNMKTTRTAVMAGWDVELQSLVKRREARERWQALHGQTQREQDAEASRTVCDEEGKYFLIVKHQSISKIYCLTLSFTSTLVL